MRKVHFRRFAVVLYRADAATVRNANSDGELLSAAKTGVHFGQLRRDLVERWIHEPIEFDFGNRPEARLGQPDRGHDDPSLVQGRINEAVRTESVVHVYVHAVTSTT